MASIFHNDRADIAKKRQPGNSPSRIITNHVKWAGKNYGRACKWCETWNDNWPADQWWMCDSCSKP
jgi:hypothetical protein